MKIKTNQWYLTRNKCKAFVATEMLHGDERCPFLGFLQTMDDGELYEQSETWMPDGRMFPEGESGADLIAECDPPEGYAP